MSQQPEFKQSMSLTDATMLVVGSMIGSGIFIVSSEMTRYLGSAWWLIGAWLITGLMTLIAALSYGELSAMYPKAGGQYVYLKESYNPLVGFLYGWSFFMVIQTGTIAAVGVAFAKFAAYIFPSVGMTDANVILELGSFKLKAGQLVSVLIVIFLTYFNTRGLQGGKIIQTLFTGAKLIALFGIIIFGFLLAGNSQILHSNFTAPIVTALEPATTTTPFLGILAMAMVGSVFSSDAWNNITFIAGEVKNPQRNIALSLVLGTGIVTLIYILANLMYLYVLPLDAIAHATDDRVGVTASSAIFGTSGAYILAVLVMVSTFGCNNGLILSGARVYYAMAKDCLFFKKAATLNKQAVPQWALWMQCLWACLLCLSGRYGDLLDYVVFVVLVFYILTIAGIFILRRTQPNTPRPYKAWGYPVLPIMYIIMASVMCVCLLIYKPAAPIFGIQGFNANPCVVGLFIVLLGIPVYYLTLSKKQP